MRKRTFRVRVWLNEMEYNTLKISVKKSGLSQEAFLRKVLNGYQVKEFPPLEFRELIRQICAIGNSLNQIAAKANSLHMLDADKYHQNYRQLLNILLSIQKKCEEPEKIPPE